MLYLAYQAHSDFMVPVRTLADLAIKVLAPAQSVKAMAFTRNLTAAYELIARAGLSHDRPPFGIDSVMVGNEEVAVHEEAARVTPFGTLLHFKKTINAAQPRVLLVAPLMAQDNNPAQPRSMTLMAGPIDTRVNPTKVNELANSKPIEWFEQNLIASVPMRYPGAFRRVYPGFVQLAAFMTMNIERHIKAHRDLYDHLANGDLEKAKVTKAFYDEYFAVLDLATEFYLETVRLVFQEHALGLGKLTWNGVPVEPRAIRRTMLLTVEGERDDICAVGQTLAAHDLCSGLRPYLKRHHMQAGVGHYGVFSGNRWTNQIYPILKNVILSSE
jgi:poly-beta-hydroxyalkanoate depolymerase